MLPRWRQLPLKPANKELSSWHHFETPYKRISGDSVVDEFYNLIDNEQSRNPHDSLQTDLSPDTSVSTSGVSPIPPIIPKEKTDSGNSSARSSVSDLVLDEYDDIDLSKLTVEERKRLPAAVVLNHMLKHGGITEDGLKLIKNKENLEDAEKLLRPVFVQCHQSSLDCE